MSEKNKSNGNKVSPAMVEKHLKGIHYPTNKEKLIQTAKGNKAPADVMGMLNRFEDKEYHSTIDVSKEIGRLE